MLNILLNMEIGKLKMMKEIKRDFSVEIERVVKDIM